MQWPSYQNSIFLQSTSNDHNSILQSFFQMIDTKRLQSNIPQGHIGEWNIDAVLDVSSLEIRITPQIDHSNTRWAFVEQTDQIIGAYSRATFILQMAQFDTTDILEGNL